MDGVDVEICLRPFIGLTYPICGAVSNWAAEIQDGPVFPACEYECDSYIIEIAMF